MPMKVMQMKPIVSKPIVRKIITPPRRIIKRLPVVQLLKKIPTDMTKGLSASKLQALAPIVIKKKEPVPVPISQTINEIPGLQLWLDAALFKGQGGSRASKWPTSSINGKIYLENTSSNSNNHPKVIDNALNGLPVLEFKTNQTMELNRNLRADNYTFIFLARQTGGVNGRLLIGNGNRLFGYWNGGKDQLYVEGWVSTPGTPPSNTSWDLYTIRRINGYTIMSRFGESVVNPSPSGANFDGLYINTGGCCGGEKSNGQVAEIAFWNRNLTEDEVKRVEGYMAWKWGLINDLDERHPYMANPTKYNPGMFPISITEGVKRGLNLIDDIKIWFDASTLTGKDPVSNLKSLTVSRKSYNLVNDANVYNRPTIKEKGLNKLSTLIFNPNQFLRLNRTLKSNEGTFIFLTRQVGGRNGRFVCGNENRLFGYWNGAKDQLHINGWLSPAGHPRSDRKWDIYVIVRQENGKTYMHRNGNMTRMISNGGVAANFDGFHLNIMESSDGEFAEMAFWKRALTKKEIQKVEGYLAWKWGLNSELPFDHPHAFKKSEFNE
jgi:hypothetical protein